MHLSKSDFKACVDCATRLHYRKNKYPSAKDENEYLQFLADGGFMVELLARSRYPGAEDLTSVRSVDESFARTRELLSAHENVTIFEAAANWDRFHVRIDILEKCGSVLRLVEIKSSSVSTKDREEQDDEDDENDAGANFLTTRNPIRIRARWLPYLQDVTFQTIVLQEAFPQFTVEPFLAVINKAEAATSAETLDQFRLKRPAAANGKQSRPEVGYVGNPGGLRETKLIVELKVDNPVGILRSSVLNSARHLAGLLTEEGASWEKPDFENRYRECKDCEYRTEPTAEDGRSGFIQCWGELAHSPTHVLDLYRVGQIGQPDPIPPLLQAKQASYLKLAEKQLGNPGGTWTMRRTMQWRGMQDGEEHLPSALQDELHGHYQTPGYPLHFIDFEACNISLPHHPGLHPYERVAFQWSCHTVDEKGRVEHREWINPGTAFPNFEFVRTLRDRIGETGTVYVWSSYEQGTLKTILEQMENAAARQLPEFAAVLPAWLDSLLGPPDKKGKRHNSPRIRDLHRLALAHYFHPRMRGRTSIKVVLPAVWEADVRLRDHPCFKRYHLRAANGSLLEPYQTLEQLPLEGGMGEVREGTAAVRIYQEMLFGQGTKDNDNRRKLLLQYCRLDTAAMMMIWMHWLGRYDVTPAENRNWNSSTPN